MKRKIIPALICSVLTLLTGCTEPSNVSLPTVAATTAATAHTVAATTAATTAETTVTTTTAAATTTAATTAIAATTTAPWVPPENPAYLDVGDSVEGFEVIGSAVLGDTHAVQLVHAVTGALVLLLPDDAKGLTVTLRTPAVSAEGMPGALACIVTRGSEKYTPDDADTFRAHVGTYVDTGRTTFSYTGDPDALLTYADFLLDGVLHPFVLTDDAAFENAVWHYVLTDDALSVKGDAYAAMWEQMTLSHTAQVNLYAALYSGSFRANDPYGTPEYFTDITRESLSAYHAAYYTPANLLLTVSGKTDYLAFLRYLDTEVLAGYAYKDVNAALEDRWEPLSAPIEVVNEFPVPEGGEPDAVIDCAYPLDLADETDRDGLMLLAELISLPTSKAAELIGKYLPDAEVSCCVDLTSPTPTFVFHAEGLYESDAALLRQAISAALTGMVADGISADTVREAAERSREAFLTDTRESLTRYWTGTGDAFGLAEYLKALKDYDSYDADTRYFEGLIKVYLTGNPVYVLSVTVCAPGKFETHAADLERRLEEIRKGMSGEEQTSAAED